MFQKVFEYAGPHKKGLYAATAVVLVSVLMGVLPFVLAYQVIAPLVMGAELDASFLILRVALVLVCLVLQAVLYGWGLNLSHKAAYDTLLRLRTALQKRFEKLPLGVIQDKGTGTVKKLFVDDVDSLEVLLAHSRGNRKPDGPHRGLCGYVFRGLEAGAAVSGLHPHQPDRHDDHVLGGHEENGPLLYGRPEDEQHHH